MLHSDNVAYLEDLVRRYLNDPSSVDESWRLWFEGPGREFVDAVAPAEGPSRQAAGLFAPKSSHKEDAVADPELAQAQSRIAQLINAYRTRGHYLAKIDPLGIVKPMGHPELEASFWGLTQADLDRVFATAPLYGPARLSLRELQAWLRETYSRTIGAEFMYADSVELRQWFQERLERNRSHIELDRDTKVYLYQELAKAESFEDFIHTKFRGAKRFSVEGGESLLPMLSVIIERAAQKGAKEVVFGMAHRGRLNVLANILGKPPAYIFAEFADNNPQELLGCGDVKYHMGFESIRTTRFGDEVNLALAYNPSHLEFVNPVVEGMVRATQDRINARGEEGQTQVVPVLIHGDAAFAGQGIVAETLNMAEVAGFETGGTIHVVVNNQIGFTTDPKDSRSTYYCTEIAKIIQAPVLHVNGEDLEAVAFVSQLAADFRQQFKRDIVIDLLCYRKYGHNESDEPTFTQPTLYAEISKHTAVRAAYRKSLIDEQVATENELTALDQSLRAELDAQLETSKTTKKVHKKPFTGRWAAYQGGADADVPVVPTGISEELFESTLRAIVAHPETFTVNPKVKRLLDRRLESLNPEVGVDWGLGEMLAYGSLILSGVNVRITGQDVTRGTFSHRHAGLFDFNSGDVYFPLHHVGEGAGRLSLYNSVLSEASVLGFEYGYALKAPEDLVIWEAQFGDFANGAQVLIDQFIASGEDKWNRLSAVTMLLPHGYEGQGPEHSSARLERFLQLAAEDNMQIVNLTTPAQIFHALRRQVVRPWRKPLVVMSPKSLLRHKAAVSYRKDFTEGTFQRVLGEVAPQALGEVERAIVCSGKVYYELLERRESTGDTKTAIIRLEQLYPYPEAQLLEVLAGYSQLREVIWVQEEPQNMGAFAFLYPLFEKTFGAEGKRSLKVRWVTRDESASPASGSAKAHAIEQADLLDRAFAN